jgi:hypothetical protein
MFKLANDGHDTRAIQAYLGHRSIISIPLHGLRNSEFQPSQHQLVFD